MKKTRTFLFTLMLMLASTAALAQRGLAINELFDGKYRNDPGATETIISGGQLSKYELSIYHGLTIKDNPTAAQGIERLVLKDAIKATNREANYRSGHLYYGFYQLLPAPNGENRYLFFLNGHLKGGKNVILIFMQGYADRTTIKRMLKK